MEDKVLPTNLSEVLFTDINGIRREGVYNEGMHAFMESLGDEGPEDPGNIYPEDTIKEWEYLPQRQAPRWDQKS